MSERSTGRPPRLRLDEWKSWLALAALFVTPPGVGTAVLTLKLDSLQAAVAKNTSAARANTEAVNGIKLELAERGDLGERIKDHETRLRALEKAPR